MSNRSPEQLSPRHLRLAAAPELRGIGPAIRALREEQGLTLRGLSEMTGLSVGFLSLVERGRSSLALTSLYAIARALGTNVGRFFPATEEAPSLRPSVRVTRADDHVDEAVVSHNRTYRMLSARAPGKVLEPLRVTVQPSDVDVEPYPHDGEEFCLVLSGELVYVVEDEIHRLGPGDSIHLPSTVRHAIRNETSEPVEAIWVLTPPLMR